MTTPTAMPSGKLCIVTASDSMAVLESRDFTPSGLSESIWRWGVSVSISKRKPMPHRKPTAAGTTHSFPLLAPISILGMSSDHIDAATITPDAKPSSGFCKRCDISPRMRNTNAAPIVVPRNGIKSANAMFPAILLPVLLLQKYAKLPQSAIPPMRYFIPH